MDDLDELASAARTPPPLRSNPVSTTQGIGTTVFGVIVLLAGIGGTAYLAVRQVHLDLKGSSAAVAPSQSDRDVLLPPRLDRNDKVTTALDSADQVRLENEAAIARDRAAAAKAEREAEDEHAINIAYREGRVVKGMTVEQARRVFEYSVAKSYYGHFGPRNVADNSDLEDGTQVVRWRSLVPSTYGPFLARSVTVKVRDGKIVSVEDVNNNP